MILSLLNITRTDTLFPYTTLVRDKYHIGTLSTNAATQPPPYIVSVSETDLKNGDYIPNSFSLKNPFGQQYLVLYKGSATSATDKKLLTFVVSDGADSMIEDDDARRVAQIVSASLRERVCQYLYICVVS